MQEGPGRMGGGGGGGGLCPRPIQTLKLTNSDNCQFRYGGHNAPPVKVRFVTTKVSNNKSIL